MMFSHYDLQISSDAMSGCKHPSWSNQCPSTENFLKCMSELNELLGQYEIYLKLKGHIFHYLISVHQCHLPRPFSFFRFSTSKNSQCHSRVWSAVSDPGNSTCGIIVVFDFILVIWRYRSNCFHKHVWFLRRNLWFRKSSLISSSMSVRMATWWNTLRSNWTWSWSPRGWNYNRFGCLSRGLWFWVTMNWWRRH